MHVFPGAEVVPAVVVAGFAVVVAFVVVAGFAVVVAFVVVAGFAVVAGFVVVAVPVGLTVVLLQFYLSFII